MILRISVALMAAIAARAAMAQAPLPDLGNAPQCEVRVPNQCVASEANCAVPRKRAHRIWSNWHRQSIAARAIYDACAKVLNG